MSTAIAKRAARMAAPVALLLLAGGAAAQEVETGPQRAPASVIASDASAAEHDSVRPVAAAPVPDERGPLGEPAPPAVAGATGAAPAADAPAVEAAAASGPAAGATTSEAAPLGAEASGPLGAPVRTPPRRSFLPTVRVEARAAPVPLVQRPSYGLVGDAFLEEQLTHQRVVDAQLDAKFELKALFAERGLGYPPRDLFFRLFKQEQVLEVWVRDAPNADTYTLLREYPICAIPGRLGPKTRIDDFQAPEGFYYIEGFNPESDFHLSLRLNYPNAADRVIGVEDSWGGDIYIHGGCSTVGCFPMTDEAMAELYWLAVEARAAGQAVIPVHVFPARLDERNMRFLRTTFARDARLLAFWENLREGYDWFESQRRLPVISVDPAGRYLFAAAAASPAAPGRPMAGAPAAPAAPGRPAAGAPAAEPGLLGEEVAPAGRPLAGAPAAPGRPLAGAPEAAGGEDGADTEGAAPGDETTADTADSDGVLGAEVEEATPAVDPSPRR